VASPPAPAPDGPRRTALAALLAATTAWKITLAVTWRGYLTGDDLEVVETAAKYAAGVRYSPWELRCLFHPLGFVWPVMKTAVIAGASSPATLDLIATAPALIASAISILLVERLACRWGLSSRAALAAAFLYAFAWLPLAYGGTPFPRPVSTAMFVGAFVLAASERRPRWSCFAAGALGAAAFAVRWSEGVALLALLAWTWWRFRDGRRLACIVSGFAAGAALCVGLVDWATWGRPFASLAAFVRIMWLEIPQSRLAIEEGFPWYLRTTLLWAGPILVLLLFPALRARRARPAIALFFSIVLLMSGFAHKEWRYLQVAIPFLAIAAAAGWERMRMGGRVSRALAAAALVLAVPYGLDRTITLFRHKVLSGIDAALFIRALSPRPRVFAFEQQWAYGERLWLGNDAEIREIEYGHPLRPRAIRAAAEGADVAAVYSLHLDRAGLDELHRLGFRAIRSFRSGDSYECSLFGRGAFDPSRMASSAHPPDERPHDLTQKFDGHEQREREDELRRFEMTEPLREPFPPGPRADPGSRSRGGVRRIRRERGR
jgi:hypothetical protein